MERRIIVSAEKPQTQCIASVKALLSWRGRASDPLPEYVEMGEGESRLVLVLSNKRDAYYTCTARDCSCPARSWHPNGPCKHQRRFFLSNHGQAPLSSAESPARKPFKPFLEDEARPAKVSSPLYVDTTPDASPREIAYWSIKEDREMLQTEA